MIKTFSALGSALGGELVESLRLVDVGLLRTSLWTLSNETAKITFHEVAIKMKREPFPQMETAYRLVMYGSAAVPSNCPFTQLLN